MRYQPSRSVLENILFIPFLKRAELQHIVLRAEAARKAAMHARQDVQTAEIGTSQQQIAARYIVWPNFCQLELYL